ncbi:ApeP family dehydratase [Facilibium subflavum]|uniref:ApeP family dehydratase n=1 Tax=Facilibium subflavum TaxID=2219058 RepID=UPI000E65A4A9|nr:hypothetical protein [Facilibium subflavum]
MKESQKRYNIDDILPQKPPMRFIDQIIKASDDKVLCQFTIRKDNLFYEPEIDGVYHWIGVEMMAQAAAVLAYFQQLEDNRVKREGFLLSVRNCVSDLTWFTCGEILEICAQKVMIEPPLGVFNCSIMINGKSVATGKFSAYQPTGEQFEQILKGEEIQ